MALRRVTLAGTPPVQIRDEERTQVPRVRAEDRAHQPGTMHSAPVDRCVVRPDPRPPAGPEIEEKQLALVRLVQEPRGIDPDRPPFLAGICGDLPRIRAVILHHPDLPEPLRVSGKGDLGDTRGFPTQQDGQSQRATGEALRDDHEGWPR